MAHLYGPVLYIEVGVVGFARPGGDPSNPDDLEIDLTKLKTYNAKLQYQ